MEKQVKIVSDGTSMGTHVLVDGKELAYVVAIYVNIQADKKLASVNLQMIDVPITLSGNVNLEEKVKKME